MKLTRQQISRWFSPSDYQKGLHYYNDGRVLTQSFQVLENEINYTATVLGNSDDYDVTINLRPNQLRGGCSCPWFAATHSCKHLIAGLLTIADGAKNQPVKAKVSTDRNARQLLNAYRSRRPQLPASSQQARIVPRLSLSQYGQSYPALSLQVGYDRFYVVKNIHDFLRAFQDHEVVDYGKNLSLRHALEEFDSRSRSLIELLFNEYDDLASFAPKYYSFTSSYGLRSSKPNEITLLGTSFDQFFDLFLGETIDAPRGEPNHRLEEGDPAVTLQLDRQSNHAKLRIPQLEGLHFFGNNRRLYAVSNHRISRCSPEFQSQVYPMLREGSAEMTMALEDLSTFCSVVLPEIRSLVQVEDESDLLQDYLPDECTPCFYFDWEDDRLVCRLKFRYGEVMMGETNSSPALIRRDTKAEEQAFLYLTSYMEYFKLQDVFVLFEEDKIFDFLTGSIEHLNSVGEVYLSERLQNKQVRSAPATVGVSVSDGMLNLDIDTGEFPLSELEALYSSLLQRRKYHRLKDGRFLALNGGSYETLAEMAHMTQLSPKDLEQGHVTMPLYRGLYLDSVLKQDENLSVSRDSQFRSMVRSFKTVSDSDYTVPARLSGILRPYQKTGYRWLKTLESCNFGGILADEMGLGKTLQVITFLTTATRAQTGLPSLIVCPASLVLNWAEECKRFAPELRVTLMLGTAAVRKSILSDNWEETDLFVTSYDLLKRDIAEYAPLSFYCCVLDEGQYIKNQSTLASKSVKRINAKQRFVLTGTPIENRLSELWNLFDFLMPGYLFKHSRFVEKLEKPIVKSGDEEAGKQLSRMVQPFLMRRLKKDVLKELPPKVEHIRKVQMEEDQRKTYLASAAAAKQEMALGDGGKLQILAALTRLRQVCCDPSLCYENYKGGSAKLEACLELCRGMTENGHQILLFSQFTSMLDRIRDGLEKAHITSFTLQGSTPKEKRAELVRRFNHGEAQVFLISLKAGGTGLNLTAADVVIHYDPWWNIAAQNQATDRAHRIGQQACVQVYKLIAKDSIEEKILDLQEQKAALMETVSGDGESIMSMSQEDLLALLD